MTRNNPRRPSSSRTPVSRPRRVAGQGGAPVEPVTEPVTVPIAEPTAEPAAEPDTAPVELTKEPATPAEPPTDPSAEPQAGPDAQDRLVEAPEVLEPRPGLASVFDSRRATKVLVSLLVLLVLAAGGLFAWDALGDDDPAEPSSQPVVITGDDATAGVDAAAKAAQTIVATSYEDYDKQVDEATALMTGAFAAKYRRTAEDIKPDFVAAKTVIDARVVAQGIVHATQTEVQALVFLNQYVSKDGGDTTYTPYRALVTVVHTDRGWLVSNLDTK
jgi:Mce-associated membrane protein